MIEPPTSSSSPSATMTLVRMKTQDFTKNPSTWISQGIIRGSCHHPGSPIGVSTPTPQLKFLAKQGAWLLSRPRLLLLTHLVVAASSPQVFPRASLPWGLHHVITHRPTLALAPPTLACFTAFQWLKLLPPTMVKLVDPLPTSTAKRPTSKVIVGRARLPRVQQ